MRIPFPQEDGSLTPYTFDLGYPLMTLIYDTLFWRDQDGIPQPWLARSADTSADGRTVTLRLAENVTWHDGAPVTSADVAFTFQFVSTRPHPRFTPQLEAIADVETPDPQTAVISLHHPSLGFLDQPLADVPILPAHLWRSLPDDETAPAGLPVGSGPFRLVDHQPGTSYRFEANPSYFRGAPAVSAVEVPIIADAETTFGSLERRSVDMIPFSLSKETATRLRSARTRILEGPAYAGTVLVLNVRRPPFDRVEVRRAVAKALDLNRIRLVVGDAVSADKGYLHPASPWSSSDVLQTFDEVSARTELAGLNLPPVEVLAPDNSQIKAETARQVSLALERAGLRAMARAIPVAELSRALEGDPGPPTFGMAIVTSSALASYDPDHLSRLAGQRLEAPLTYSGWASSAFDTAAQKVASSLDPIARRAAVQEELEILAAEAPVVPLIFPNGQFAVVSSRYEGWVFVKGSGIFDKRSFVDPGPTPTTTVTAAGGRAADPVGQSSPLGVIAATVLMGGALLAGVVVAIRR